MTKNSRWMNVFHTCFDLWRIQMMALLIRKNAKKILKYIQKWNFVELVDFSAF